MAPPGVVSDLARSLLTPSRRVVSLAPVSEVRLGVNILRLVSPHRLDPLKACITGRAEWAVVVDAEERTSVAGRGPRPTIRLPPG